MMKNPIWKDFSRDKLDDGKYNYGFLPWPFRNTGHVPFPGYIANKDYPFTHINMLTHGETNEFSGSDGPNDLKTNLLRAPADWKYRTKKVHYDVNSGGYRTKEWDQINWKEAIVLFGCSCTYGIGLAEDETISYHLSKLTGREVVNLGVPSGSNELIVNNCAAMIKNFGLPYAVSINWSTTDRFRYYAKKEYHDLGMWTKNTEIHSQVCDDVDMEELWKLSYADPYNELGKAYYLSTYADAMFEGRTKYSKISFFELSAHYTRSESWFKIDNGARDMVHPGEGNSIEVATYLAGRFK